MRESVFQGEWKRSIEEYFGEFKGFHYVKIPDTPKFSGSLIPYSPPRPYDCYLLHSGKFRAYELKMHKSLTGFPFGNVSDNQIDNLVEVANAGGKGYVVINYRKSDVSENHIKKYNLKGKRFNIVYAIPIFEFLKLRDITYDDRGSIPFDFFLNHEESLVSDIERQGQIWDVVQVL